MKKMTYAEIEEWIANVEELYWWGMSYCKEHRCTVRQFIKDNYADILTVIERNGGC